MGGILSDHRILKLCLVGFFLTSAIGFISCSPISQDIAIHDLLEVASTVTSTISISSPSPDQYNHFTPTQTIRPSSTPFYLPSIPTPTPWGFPSSLRTIEDIERYAADREFDAVVIHKDINGDSHDDVIVFNRLQIVVFLGSERESELYNPTLFLEEDRYRGIAGSRIQFTDWTFDGSPEIELDQLIVYASGSSESYTWFKTIYQCKYEECHRIWQGRVGSLFLDGHFGGICTEREFPRPLMASNGLHLIRSYQEGFDIYGCGEMSEALYAVKDHHRIQQGIVAWYEWNGDEYTFSHEEVANYAQDISSNSLTRSIGPAGQIAEISILRDLYMSPHTDSCQIKLNGEILGPSFSCKHNFSRIAWEDMTGDLRKDLVVTVFSGPNYVTSDYPYISCPHQHLLAYEIHGNEARKIADISGCSIDTDLFGVRLEDIDQDGVAEILSAGLPVNENPHDCFYFENDRVYEINPDKYETCLYTDFTRSITVYRWNGSVFSP